MFVESEDQRKMRESIIFDVQVLSVEGNKWTPEEVAIRVRNLGNIVDEYNFRFSADSNSETLWKEVPNCKVEVVDTNGQITNFFLSEDKSSGKLLFYFKSSASMQNDEREFTANELVMDVFRKLGSRGLEKVSSVGDKVSVDQFLQQLVKLKERIKFYNQQFTIQRKHPSLHYINEGTDYLDNSVIEGLPAQVIFSLYRDQTGKFCIGIHCEDKVLKKNLEDIFKGILYSGTV